jgi:nitroreductase
VRAFLSKAVAKDDIQAILALAARAPSGTNTQPWKVYVLRDGRLQQFKARVMSAFQHPQAATLYTEEYAYYPRQWVSPYLERRRQVGWDLYSLLGITRDNKQGMHLQHGRNFQFFDAPVGLIFTIDRIMEQGSWLDYGMFLQNIMLAAKARGLDTCPQAAFTQFHQVIQQELTLPSNEMLVCGMSLGYADTNKIENTLMTSREHVDKFTTFLE